MSNLLDLVDANAHTACSRKPAHPVMLERKTRENESRFLSSEARNISADGPMHPILFFIRADTYRFFCGLQAARDPVAIPALLT